MAKYIIQGKNPLGGEIKVSGAKNLALKIIPACLLSHQESVIENVPFIEDVERMIEILQDFGVSVQKNNHTLQINPSTLASSHLDQKKAQKIRSSIMLIGPLLARLKELYLPHPGGCTLGKRPIDIFIDGFKAFGVRIYEDKGGYYFQTDGKLKGCRFFFPIISVTGTESMILGAALAEGKTLLENCACEPEIAALAEYLNQCGAKITGAGTHTIEIEGVESLSGGKYVLMPDRIEAGSLAILGAALNAELLISQCNPKHLQALWCIFDKIGVKYTLGKDFIVTHPSLQPLKAASVKTHEYPGFATDIQAPMTVLLTQTQGTSMVHETIFDGRLYYTDSLNQMGAQIILCDPHRAIVAGPTPLYGKKVASPDLRAGIAMVIAGLLAEGATEIDNIYQIERGYENIVERLKQIGAKIEKIN